MAGGPRVADSKLRLQPRASTSQCCVDVSIVPESVGMVRLDGLRHCPDPFGWYTRRLIPRTRPAVALEDVLRGQTWCIRRCKRKENKWISRALESMEK